MTINTRNKVIVSGISLSALLLVGFLIAVVLIFQRLSAGNSGTYGDINLTPILVSLLSELLLTLVAATILYFSFRKTTAPEIFFFIIFLITVGFDSLKSSFVLFELLDLSPYYRVLITRAIYFARFLGTLAILASGLFSLGAEYQRMELFLGVGFLLAFSLSATVPVDITQTEHRLLYVVINAKELGIASVLFLTFGVFNYVLYAIQNASKDHALMAIGLAFVVVGREMLFFLGGSIALIAAFVMLIGGIILYAERTHAVHLWS